jgi:hypothetical protein
MVTKSLPTFKHTSIGSKTHKARTATAHVSYIMRSDAMTEFQAENMPEGGRGTRVFFDKLWEKAGMPENARIADKLMIALPVELTAEQRHEVLHDFMEELGEGRISWCAAHHDTGDDAHNPHAHVVFKDADIDTGRKVIGTTTSSRDVREAKEHGWKVPPRTTTADMRKMWCEHLNDYMERAGIDIRYDPRKLKEQGIDREPEIHIGPKAQVLDEKGYEFESHDQIRGDRSIPYTLFDEDSRAEHNAHIKEANSQKEKESANRNHAPQPPAREGIEMRTLRKAQLEARKVLYDDQQQDRDALRLAHEAEKRQHEKWARKLYAGARQEAYDAIKEQYADKWEDVRAIDNLKERERAARALKAEQKKSYASEAARAVNQRRPEKDKAWKAMLSSQEKERLDLRALHCKENAALSRQHIAERLGVHEKWRGRHFDRQANRIEKRLTNKQGMAAQQNAALATIRFHGRLGQLGADRDDEKLAVNPREAARRHFEMAHFEHGKYEAIRAELHDKRRRNLERAGIANDSHNRAAQMQRGNVQTGRNGGANAKASPKDILLPGIKDAKDSQAKRIQEQMRDDYQKQQDRKAEAPDRKPASDNRTNASPNAKDQITRRDRASQGHLPFMNGNNSPKKDRGKDSREGGGRGR